MSRTTSMMCAVALLAAVGALGSLLAKAEAPQYGTIASAQIDAMDLMSTATNPPVQTSAMY
jgi:hypothetical protein